MAASLKHAGKVNVLLLKVEVIRVSTDPGNPGYPGKTLEFKRILEFLEKPGILLRILEK